MAHFFGFNPQDKILTKGYELIEHTADICIRVKGVSLAELFKNFGLAIFDVIAEKQQVRNPRQESIKISQKADNPEELLVNWLNELLSLSATRNLIFENFQIEKIGQNNITAWATGSDVKNYRLNVEVKAATYHELKIEKNAAGWLAQIIFDV
jgi:SHS2 domain-containing protein